MNIPEWVKLAGSIVVLVGVVVFILWRLSPIIFFRYRAKSAEGRITNWMSMREKGVTYFYPMVEFITQDGKKISYRANERCEGRPMYPVGTKVIVRYDAKDPKNVRTQYPTT